MDDMMARARPQSATTAVTAANWRLSMPGANAAALSTSTKLTPSTIGPMYNREPVSTVDRERSCIRLMTTKIRPMRTAAAEPTSR